MNQKLIDDFHKMLDRSSHELISGEIVYNNITLDLYVNYRCWRAIYFQGYFENVVVFYHGNPFRNNTTLLKYDKNNTISVEKFVDMIEALPEVEFSKFAVFPTEDSIKIYYNR